MTNLLPDLTGEEFADLKQSISDRGVLMPVLYDQEGVIVDGHHRVRACRELGLTDWPRQTVTVTNEGERALLALACNLYRRHMSIPKRRALVKELRARGMSLRAVSRLAGVSDVQVLRDVAGAEEPERVTGSDGRTYPAKRLSPAENSTRLAKMRERREAGDTIHEIALVFGLADSTVSKALTKAGGPRARIQRPTVGQSMKGLQQAAIQVESLAESLDAGHLGDWSKLYDIAEAQVWFDSIDRALPLLTARLKRVLRDRRAERGKAS